MTSGTTENLNLPQYEMHDHPDFLTEINEAFRTIDSAITELQAEVALIKESVTSLGRSLKNE